MPRISLLLRPLVAIIAIASVWLPTSVSTALPAGLVTEAGRWPVRPASVVRGFAPPSVRWGAGHRGIDLASHPGQSVIAPRDGVVVFAARIAGRGVLVLQHGALRTTYEPVTPSLRPGTSVVAGQRIAVVATGTGHCGSGSCLHWGLLRGETYLDPRLLLNRHPVLKPP